jgi:hypothetical protein
VGPVIIADTLPWLNIWFLSSISHDLLINTIGCISYGRLSTGSEQNHVCPGKMVTDSIINRYSLLH